MQRALRMLMLATLAITIVAVPASARSIAYNFNAGQAGNQGFGGELGNDFTVNVPIRVTEVGVFDEYADGIAGTLTSQIWTRSGNTGSLVPGTTMAFTAGDPGALEGGVRLKALPAPVTLPVGTYTFASNGHSAADRNLNSNAGGFPRYADNGYGAVTTGPATAPGLITIEGQKRYGATANTFPNAPDGNWLYGSGTFAFEQAYPTAYTVFAGTTGAQNYGGSLGMDFDAQRPMTITHLGVFDSAQDGINGTLTARLYARTPGGTGVELASVAFTGSDGELIGGSRFIELPTPIALPGGFQGTIVAEGYNAAELLANSGGTPTQWRTFDGDGALAFVGSSRFGTAGAFPATPDGGPADRYAAGSFMFDTSGPVLPVGKIEELAMVNPSFELNVRTTHPAPGHYGSDTTGWTPSAGTNAGDFRPSAGLFTQPVPDGAQVAWLNSGSLYSDNLPGPGLEADTLYIVDSDWGSRTDQGPTNHSMNLQAGTVNLGWLNDSNMRKGPAAPVGTFEHQTAYFSANHNAAIGSPLQLKIDKGSGGQTIYDNVRVTKISGAAILLNNPSFELDNVAPNGGWQPGVTGWVPSGFGGGVFEDAGQITPAEGLQSGLVFGGGSLTQTLTGVPLEAGYRYILLADVADRNSTGLTFGGYRVELLAGGQTVAMDDDSLGVIQDAGYFYVTSALDVFINTDHPLLGQDLGIRLSAPIGSGNPHQTYFDNVRLFAVYVPEPATLSLLGLGGLALFRRRRRR